MKARLLIACTLTAASLSLGPGCAGTPKSGPQPDPPPAPVRAVGEVLKTRPDYGYVIVSFMVMPEAGRELSVFRGGQRVGSVRVTERRRPPFAAAVLLDGTPRPGDVVRP